MEEINFDALSKEYGVTNEKRIKANELKKEQQEKKARIIVTTCDLKQDYEVVGPVYMQINSKSQSSSLINKYSTYIEELKKSGLRSSDDKSLWLLFYQSIFLDSGTYNNRFDNFDIAFFIAVEELKEKAVLMGADAVIGMRQDIDLDTNGRQYFYLQMYGTAVKFK